MFFAAIAFLLTFALVGCGGGGAGTGEAPMPAPIAGHVLVVLNPTDYSSYSISIVDDNGKATITSTSVNDLAKSAAAAGKMFTLDVTDNGTSVATVVASNPNANGVQYATLVANGTVFYVTLVKNASPAYDELQLLDGSKQLYSFNEPSGNATTANFVSLFAKYSETYNTSGNDIVKQVAIQRLLAALEI